MPSQAFDEELSFAFEASDAFFISSSNGCVLGQDDAVEERAALLLDRRNVAFDLPAGSVELGLTLALGIAEHQPMVFIRLLVG